MYGAFLGDMIGSPYEFDRGKKTKEFPLFSSESQFTDDSVMTVAVAQALLDTMGQDDAVIRKVLKAQKPQRALFSWPGTGAERKISRHISPRSSAMIFPGPAMRSVHHTAMWKVARRPCRKLSQHSSKVRTSKT